MRHFLAKPVIALLLVQLVAAALPPSTLAQNGQDDAPAWTVTDQREIDVDGELVSLSPDGNWIAGLGDDQQFCIWAVADLAATCEDTPFPPLTASFTWAPDSSAIAWSSDAARLLIDSDIMLFDIASMTLENLTDTPDEPSRASFSDEASPPILMDVFPTWSPDGETITFIRSSFSPDAVPNTHIMNVDPQTGDVEQYFVIPTPQFMVVYSLMFYEPDGSLLVSILPPRPDSGVTGIWRIDPGGTRLDKVLEGGESSEFPLPYMTDLSADGRWLSLMSPVAFGNPEADLDPYALFDLDTGELSIFSGDVRPSATATFGGPEDQLIYPTLDAGTKDIVITIGSEPLDETFPVGVTVGGDNWAANNTMLLPYLGRSSDDAGILLTLTPTGGDRSDDGHRIADPSPTPKPPCGCVPPPDGVISIP